MNFFNFYAFQVTQRKSWTSAQFLCTRANGVVVVAAINVESFKRIMHDEMRAFFRVAPLNFYTKQGPFPGPHNGGFYYG